MKIYNQQNELLLDVAVDDNSYRNRVVMGDNNLTLYYSLPQHVEIPIGSWCEFQGEVYTLMLPEQLKMQHSRQYDYTVIFSASQDKAKMWKFRNPVDGRLRFSLTATPREHLQMFVDNMNRRDSGWSVGDCITGTDKLITYDLDFCYDALNKMASEFETEFEIEDKTVSLHKVEYNKNEPLDLAYGKGNGLKPGIGRNNSSDTPAVEILYVQGGNRNIDRSKYPENETLRASSNGCLLLPCGQIIAYDGEYFEDEDGYNAASSRRYIVDDLGLSIRNLDREPGTLCEDSLDCSEYYPKHIGTVTSWECVDTEKHFYDFFDTNLPDDLDFNDYTIEGEKLSMIFQSGELAGREFDVIYHHENKRFEIVPQEIDGILMPDETFRPGFGNEYAVFGCLVPPQYIRNDATKSGASWEMFRAAVRYLFDKEEKRLTFTAELDGLWAKRDWDNIGGKIRLGGYINFVDPNLAPDGALVRITAIKENVSNPHSPKIELSNEPVSVSVGTTIKQLETAEAAAENLHREALQFTKRRFRDAKETAELLAAAQKSLADKYAEAISPIAVHTMSMLVGDTALQFRFVTDPYNPQPIPSTANLIVWNNNAKQLTAQAGLIQHMTLGIDSLCPQHQPNEYRYWSVSSFASGVIDDEKPRYLYIKAQKTAIQGVVLGAQYYLSPDALDFEATDCYNLLVGILCSEIDGERSFSSLYGFTEILPGQIIADRLVASDGVSYFDMAAAALKLKDKLEFNVNGDGQLRIKGSLVQNAGGVTAPIGCYRGTYDETLTYYQGDEVTYTVDGLTSTYRYISATPAKGIDPTSTLHWQILALGVKGKDGTSLNMKGEADGHMEEWVESRGPKLMLYDKKVIAVGNFIGGVSCFIEQSNKITHAEVGDAYIVKSTGELFVADGVKWVNCGVIKGEQGEAGKAGAAAVFRGEYSATTKYIGSDIRKDVVKYNDQYWIAKNVNKEFSGQPPTTSSTYWEAFGGSYESIATGLLLAEKANIANLIFQNQRLESFGKHPNGNPYFYIDGKMNEAAFDGGNVKFSKDKANIGWLEVVEQQLIGYEGTTERLVITPDILPDWDVKQEVDTIMPTNFSSTMPGKLNTGSEYAAPTNNGGVKSRIDGTLTQAADISYSFQFQVNIVNDKVTLYIDSNEMSFKSTGNYGLVDSSFIPKATATVTLGNKKIGSFELTKDKGEIYLEAAGIYTVKVEVKIDRIPNAWSGRAEFNLNGLWVTHPVSKTFIARDGIMTVYNANYIRLNAKEGITTKVNK